MSTALASLCGAAAFSGWTASAGVTRPSPMLRARTPVAGFFDRFENPFSQKAAVEEVNNDSSDAEQKRLRAETLRLKANIGAQRRENRLAFEHAFELRQGKRAKDHLATPFFAHNYSNCSHPAPAIWCIFRASLALAVCFFCLFDYSDAFRLPVVAQPSSRRRSSP